MSKAASIQRTCRLPDEFEWTNGPIAEAVSLSERVRLREFIKDEESPPLAMFSPESRANSHAGDWYGEHVGKWLCAAVSTWRSGGGSDWQTRIGAVVVKLIEWQEPNGYLGTYSPDAPCRFTHYDAANVRTWDLWTHAWTMLGLIDASSVPDCEGALDAAVRIGDLILDTFPEPANLLDQGNHDGLSSACVIEPLARLTLATGACRFAEFAANLVEAGDRRWSRELLVEANAEVDVADIGTGKAYQLLWILVGLTYLFEATADGRLLIAAETHWENVVAWHLSPLGGPWGGIATHKEVFNPQGYFNPSGLVETCSTATWMTLSRRLFELTGHPKYAQAFETSLANALIGAQDKNGADWCYFTFANGRRNNTYSWACCKSSGALALAEAWKLAAFETDESILVEVPFPFIAKFGSAAIAVGSDFIEGVIAVSATGNEKPIRVRIPNWAGKGNEYVNLPANGGHVRIGAPIRVVPFTDTLDHHGQEIVRADYAYVARGPFVYATGLFEGDLQQKTIRLAKLNPASHISEDDAFPTLRLAFPGADSIYMLPYYLCGGRHDGAWRTTWLSVAWQ